MLIIAVFLILVGFMTVCKQTSLQTFVLPKSFELKQKKWEEITKKLRQLPEYNSAFASPYQDGIQAIAIMAHRKMSRSGNR